MNTKLNIFILALFILLAGKTYGQYAGPGASDKSYTVKEVLDKASRLDRADVQVKLQGTIISQINNDTYQFKDATGTIRVEIKKKDLPDKPFDENTQLIIIGEVDYDLLEGTEIEVDRIEFAPDK